MKHICTATVFAVWMLAMEICSALRRKVLGHE